MRNKEEDIYYMVKVKEDRVDDLFCKTTVSRMFCGKLVNPNGSHFYFELNGSGALVIIPHNWIEWMAPSKIHWTERKKAKTFSEICDEVLPKYVKMEL